MTNNEPEDLISEENVERYMADVTRLLSESMMCDHITKRNANADTPHTCKDERCVQRMIAAGLITMGVGVARGVLGPAELLKEVLELAQLVGPYAGAHIVPVHMGVPPNEEHGEENGPPIPPPMPPSVN